MLSLPKLKPKFDDVKSNASSHRHSSAGSHRSSARSDGAGSKLNTILSKSQTKGTFNAKRNSKAEPTSKLAVDRHNAHLKAFFQAIQTKHKLDPEKLWAKTQLHFEDQAPSVFSIIKRVFGNFRLSINYSEYCQYVSKFINIDLGTCKELFFHYFDQNKDNIVCETDLFTVMKNLKAYEMSDIVVSDLILI